MLDDSSNQTLIHQLPEGSLSETSVDFQALTEKGWGYQLVVGNFGKKSIVGALIE